MHIDDAIIMAMEIYLENHWLDKDETFAQMSLIDISYECLNLGHKQHSFSFVILGLGVLIFWHE